MRCHCWDLSALCVGSSSHCTWAWNRRWNNSRVWLSTSNGPRVSHHLQCSVSCTFCSTLEWSSNICKIFNVCWKYNWNFQVQNITAIKNSLRNHRLPSVSVASFCFYTGHILLSWNVQLPSHKSASPILIRWGAICLNASHPFYILIFTAASASPSTTSPPKISPSSPKWTAAEIRAFF